MMSSYTGCVLILQNIISTHGKRSCFRNLQHTSTALHSSRNLSNTSTYFANKWVLINSIEHWHGLLQTSFVISEKSRFSVRFTTVWSNPNVKVTCLMTVHTERLRRLYSNIEYTTSQEFFKEIGSLGCHCRIRNSSVWPHPQCSPNVCTLTVTVTVTSHPPAVRGTSNLH